jgi:hypothetical protein
MPENNVLIVIAEFVRQARDADNPTKVTSCVDDGLARVQACGLSKDSAVHMLTTAIVSTSVNKAGSTSPPADPDTHPTLGFFTEQDHRCIAASLMAVANAAAPPKITVKTGLA